MCCLKAPNVGGSLSLSAIYLQNIYQRRSGMLSIQNPFGLYAWQTNFARFNSWFSLIYSWAQRPVKASMMASLDCKNNFIQVFFPTPAKRPVLSVPENAWNPNRAFDLSGPRDLHIGSISLMPETIEILVFVGNLSKFEMRRIKPSVSGEKKCYLCFF